MPRNESGVYILPAGVIVTTGENILPSQHNPALQDFASDANAVRPIVSGGTGATTAAGARAILGAAPDTAAINAGAGLTGGGNIASTVTLSLEGQALALHNLSSNGIVARTSAGALSARTITGTADQIIVTNGNGAGGNPTIAPVIATQAEAEAGTDNVKLMTALRTKQALNVTGDAPIFACRAWVNFDGTTTPPTIRASGNVASVIRNGIGDYTVNFTTAMPDANYAVTGAGNRLVDVPGGEAATQIGISNLTTTSFRLGSQDNNNDGYENSITMCVAVFR